MLAQFSVREIRCKSAINRVRGMPFEWSLNPYRGCRHACVYCYARPTHEYLGLDANESFQEIIFAKVNAPDVLRGELARKSWRGDNVVIGTATDPYQQAESRYHITREVLRAFKDFRNPLSITTKSPMVLRDLDILSDLAQHAEVTVHFTVTTVDLRLWKLLEPTTSKPHKRLEAIRVLRSHGIKSGIFLSPILPGITDDEEHLASVLEAGADYGVDFVYAAVLRLGPGISEYYLPFLDRNFPDQLERYRSLFPGNYASRAYQDRIMTLVDQLKERYGLADTPGPKAKVRLVTVPVQMPLF